MKALRAIAAFLALVVLCVALSPSDAEAQRRRRRRSSSSSTVSVEVVDVSGGRAYVAPGETAGVGRGSEIRIGSDEYVEATPTHLRLRKKILDEVQRKRAAQNRSIKVVVE